MLFSVKLDLFLKYYCQSSQNQMQKHFHMTADSCGCTSIYNSAASKGHCCKTSRIFFHETETTFFLSTIQPLEKGFEDEIDQGQQSLCSRRSDMVKSLGWKTFLVGSAEKFCTVIKRIRYVKSHYCLLAETDQHPLNRHIHVGRRLKYPMMILRPPLGRAVGEGGSENGQSNENDKLWQKLKKLNHSARHPHFTAHSRNLFAML